MKKIYTFVHPSMTENDRPSCTYVAAESFETAIYVSRSNGIDFTNVTEGPECIISE